MSNTGGTTALISSTFQNETVTYNYTTGTSPSVPGAPIFSDTTELGVSNTPLPAALPLFATGLGGLGLLGWRRKRKTHGVL